MSDSQRNRDRISIYSRLRPKLRHLRRLFIAAALSGVALAFTIAAVRIAFPFPWQRLEDWPVSPRVEDRDGRPLLQIVGDDDQWRFHIPLTDMSPWIVQATIAAEDERFRSHGGVDVTAVCRAVLQNINSGQVVSGASTITMQLCRMADPRPRKLTSKLIEAVRALEIEGRLTKDQILKHYLNVAPYGGNIRGVEAAAWRFFDRRASDLSLGQAALLAGLPQSPSSLRPDRFPDRAIERARYVLRRMRELEMIGPIQENDALAESKSWLASSLRSRIYKNSDQPVPFARSLAIPATDSACSSHVAWLALQHRSDGGRTTIDSSLQDIVAARVTSHLTQFTAGTDAAVVVLDIASSEILVLIGSGDPNDPIDGQVNGALARRSPGSTLKPFIYAAAFESRRLNADSVVQDVPVERAGWRPDNFDRSFHGAMSVTTALQQSRNVPAILVMEALGPARCCGILEAVGIDLEDSAASRGGLAVAVGAVETSLLDLTNAYATLGRDGVRCRPRLFIDESPDGSRVLERNTCRTINDILSTSHRTPSGLADVPVDRLPWFMWKTGTSSGRRDAWAIGHNGRYALGVWVGRFSGAGHPDFTGRHASEPLLAELFSLSEFRRDDPPEPPQPIIVKRPIRFALEKVAGPSITSPSPQAEFVCLDGVEAKIPIAGQYSESATWFLNGSVVELNVPTSLPLTPGRFELRCVDPHGRSDSVHFRVSARNPERHSGI